MKIAVVAIVFLFLLSGCSSVATNNTAASDANAKKEEVAKVEKTCRETPVKTGSRVRKKTCR
ncbi:hypothetical protein [Aliikangiella coralliicola]|uniref:Entry exclusion lipoprotein TrbK n=1 Tax=Aliikangiella coralliicola TaxID=2592383 RepID=A0A545UFG6_9GAMM|nr:hypothetical protein [Aliikangiella coralliicola]TQV88214.1 hypothetical protein FLL46_06720 [Aliikangiella coralliicola]